MERYRSVRGGLQRSIVLRGTEHRSWIRSTNGKLAPDASAWWQQYLRGGAVQIVDEPGAPISTVDLFSGCGGLTLGAREAARAVGRTIRSVAAIDIDGEALSVHRANFSTELLITRNASSLVDFHVLGRGGDARFAYPPELVDRDLCAVGAIDLLLAGPPCQGHSNLNNRTRRDDPRNILYLTTVAVAVALHARAVVIENVPEVINDKSDVVTTARALLKAEGYGFVDVGTLAADELGAPQSRRRFFLIAAKAAQLNAITVSQIASFLRRDPTTVEWAIGDLLKASSNSILDSVPALSIENVRRIDFLFDNDLYDLPDAERPDCHKDGTTYTSVYGRMRWNRPAQTITTGFATPGRGRFIHPIERRVLTAREAARLQCFPDSFNFLVNDQPPPRNLLSKWIGDAVPSVLGYAATLPALSCL